MTRPTTHVDVLIVGAGPAGLMLANWMSRCGIKTRVVDKRGTKVFSLSFFSYHRILMPHACRSSTAKQTASNAEH